MKELHKLLSKALQIVRASYSVVVLALNIGILHCRLFIAISFSLSNGNSQEVITDRVAHYLSQMTPYPLFAMNPAFLSELCIGLAVAFFPIHLLMSAVTPRNVIPPHKQIYQLFIEVRSIESEELDIED